MSRRCVDTLLVLVVALGGCASAPPEPEPIAAVPVEPVAAVEQFDRAITLLGAGDLELAIRELRALSDAYPQYSGPLVNLGIAHLKSGQIEAAEQAFAAAIERNPDNAVAYNQLGILHRQQGRFQEADAAYSRAIAIAPDYALAHLNLGVLCDLYLQQPERALDQYEQYMALTATPEPKVTGWIAELRSRLGSSRTARIER